MCSKTRSRVPFVSHYIGIMIARFVSPLFYPPDNPREPFPFYGHKKPPPPNIRPYFPFPFISQMVLFRDADPAPAPFPAKLSDSVPKSHWMVISNAVFLMPRILVENLEWVVGGSVWSVVFSAAPRWLCGYNFLRRSFFEEKIGVVEGVREKLFGVIFHFLFPCCSITQYPIHCVFLFSLRLFSWYVAIIHE